MPRKQNPHEGLQGPGKCETRLVCPTTGPSQKLEKGCAFRQQDLREGRFLGEAFWSMKRRVLEFVFGHLWVTQELFCLRTSSHNRKYFPLIARLEREKYT